MHDDHPTTRASACPDGSYQELHEAGGWLRERLAQLEGRRQLTMLEVQAVMNQVLDRPWMGGKKGAANLVHARRGRARQPGPQDGPLRLIARAPCPAAGRELASLLQLRNRARAGLPAEHWQCDS
jgi:hypothetical protein